MTPQVIVHGHPRPARFAMDRFVAGLRAALPSTLRIGLRPPLLETVALAETAAPRRAWRVACTRVLDPMRSPHPRVVCSTLEHADEIGALTGERPPTGRPPPEGALYDAAMLMEVCRDLIPAEERRLDQVHLVLTDRLFGTYQRSDGRYHARVVLAAGPHLLSSSGLVEAPARPRGYYAALAQGQAGMGPGQVMLEQALEDEIVVHGDRRIPAFLVGYALQAILWQLAGEAFCDDPSCRLFNAHWQSELVQAQSGGRLCTRHAEMLASL